MKFGQLKRCSANVPVAAMSDIAFLLLIFFMITASPIQESRIRYERAKGEELKYFDPANVSVIIDADGELYLNGMKTGVGTIKEEVSYLLGSRKQGERLVFFKIDRNAKAAKFEPVYEQIAAAEGELILILDPRPKGEVAGAPAPTTPGAPAPTTQGE